VVGYISVHEAFTVMLYVNLQRRYPKDQVLILRPFKTTFWRSWSWGLAVCR